MWDQLFDYDLLNFLIACSCFGAAWGCFELAARQAKKSNSADHRSASSRPRSP